MKVKEAYKIISDMKTIVQRLKRQAEQQIDQNVWESADKVNKYNQEIKRIEELILNQELEDSHKVKDSFFWIKGEEDDF